MDFSIQSDEVKEKDKSDKSSVKMETADSITSKDDRQDNSSAWKKDEKKEKEVELVVANHVNDHSHESNEACKKKGKILIKFPFLFHMDLCIHLINGFCHR